MTTGYWDRDGYHEGVMPAVDFAQNNPPRRAPIDDLKPEGEDNRRQSVIGVPRGGCESPTRESRP